MSEIEISRSRMSHRAEAHCALRLRTADGHANDCGWCERDRLPQLLRVVWWARCCSRVGGGRSANIRRVRASGGTNELLWPKSGPQQSFPKQKNTSLFSFYCGGGLDSGVSCHPGRENGAAAASLSSVVPTAPFSPTAASSTPRTGRTGQGQTGAVGEPGGARGGRKRS